MASIRWTGLARDHGWGGCTRARAEFGAKLGGFVFGHAATAAGCCGQRRDCKCKCKLGMWPAARRAPSDARARGRICVSGLEMSCVGRGMGCVAVGVRGVEMASTWRRLSRCMPAQAYGHAAHCRTASPAACSLPCAAVERPRGKPRRNSLLFSSLAVFIFCHFLGARARCGGRARGGGGAPRWEPLSRPLAACVSCWAWTRRGGLGSADGAGGLYALFIKGGRGRGAMRWQVSVRAWMGVGVAEAAQPHASAVPAVGHALLLTTTNSPYYRPRLPRRTHPHPRPRPLTARRPPPSPARDGQQRSPRWRRRPTTARRVTRHRCCIGPACGLTAHWNPGLAAIHAPVSPSIASSERRARAHSGCHGPFCHHDRP